MKAVCVTEKRGLEVRDVPTPTYPPSGHVLVDIDACGINHGDKTFLARPTAMAGLQPRLHDVWGASASGKVCSIGADVPAEFAGKNVAVYRSLTQSARTVGTWCERAMVPYRNCLILPEKVPARDYCGSLVRRTMSIKLVPLSRLEADPQGTLSEQPGGRSLGSTVGLRRYHRAQFVIDSSHDSPRSLSRSTVERETWSAFWLDAARGSK